MSSKILNPATGRPFVEVSPSQEIFRIREEIVKHFKGKYDAAQTTSQNTNHWRMADELSPDSANSLGVRSVLRKRSRYETANSGYLLGTSLTVTGDMVGSGPTLQVTDSRFTEEQQDVIERSWLDYTREIKLRNLIWSLRLAKLRDGESFLVSTLDFENEHNCKIGYRWVECDQISNPYAELVRLKNADPYEVDGVRFKPSNGKPYEYHLLDNHPGEMENITSFSRLGEGRWIPENQVIHWFRTDRPWKRGIPETTATLPLWALLRRYTLAVVQNAEIAADFTALLTSLQPPSIIPFNSSGTPSQPVDSPENWFNSFPVDRGLMTVLPNGYDIKQLDPKQPVTMYDAFVAALIQEACRPLLVPRNHALGNSGGYNMASGSLDRQLYKQAIQTERLSCNDEVLCKIFKNFWFEASRIPNFFEDDPSIFDVIRSKPSLKKNVQHSHRWDELSEHTDPLKVAQALDLLHKGGHLSDIDIQEGRYNRNVNDHYRNLQLQNKWRSENQLQGLSEKLPESQVQEDSGDDSGEEDSNDDGMFAYAQSRFHLS